MNTLILEDFRCFAGRHEVPIRPLTLLVGENSTGKTSFLAAIRAAQDRTEPNFNEEPFRLGSYEQIANNQGRPAERFALGLELKVQSDAFPQNPGGLHGIRMEAGFASRDEQPALAEISASTGAYRLRMKGLQGERPELSYCVGDRVVAEGEISGEFRAGTSRRWNNLYAVASRMLHSAPESGATIAAHEAESFSVLSFWTLQEPFGRPYAFAPIRTSPRRTYDPGAEPRRPGGSHIPMTLAAWLGGDDKLYDEELTEFGQASGLYADLGIRKLGEKGSDPFQIEVRPAHGGPARNLIDVGYGVSQAIPIIADCVSAPMTMLLLQQPEVHLHPRAQAAIGSFFAQLAANRFDPVVVETHSDYLVDRVRMDVRDEKIRPSDVMILYFEHGEKGVDIHPIELDAEGRVVDVPPGYRSFFLEEQRRFFGVD